MQGSLILLGAGLAWILLGCGSSSSNSVPNAPLAEKVPARPVVLPTGPLPRYSLTHWPWNGIRTTVEVFDDADARVLRVYRGVDPQYLDTWKLKLNTSEAAAIDDVIKELISGAGTVQSCPRPRGPDGALWISRAYAAKSDCVADFRVEGGGPECAQFEARAVKLMQLARLQCGFAACIRPEERSSNKFSCSLGSEGNECRDPSNEHNTIPRNLMKGMRD